MAEAKKSVADLKPGELGTVCCFNDRKMALKLMEMGCLPGSEVKISCKAPFGDPICIMVSGYSLSLRKEEAATIMIK